MALLAVSRDGLAGQQERRHLAMNSDFGVPEVAQNVCHEELAAGLMVVIRDLGIRAAALDTLIASATPARRIHGGRVTPDVDAQAWFAAVKAAEVARPALTSTP